MTMIENIDNGVVGTIDYLISVDVHDNNMVVVVILILLMAKVVVECCYLKERMH